jgi:hypothetical protein
LSSLATSKPSNNKVSGKFPRKKKKPQISTSVPPI